MQHINQGLQSLQALEEGMEQEHIELAQLKIAALWIVVMFCMTFADIIGFVHPGALQKIIDGAVGVELTQSILLVLSVVNVLPIVMIFLSLVLPTPHSRWLNTSVVVLTSFYVIGGGSITLSYLFFAILEILSMLTILWYVWAKLGKGNRLILVA